MKTNQPRQWNYDYSRTLWMKMYLAEPDFENRRSRVFITFEQALEIIRVVDNLTQGIEKIVYLVGWQGLGHDDCYPEMEVVNEALKRACDATARDSLFWLFEEAKKYHTVISFHGNLADAYRDTPCFPELAATNSVVFTFPELIAMNWFPHPEKYRSISSSALLMMPTKVMPNTPRCERTSSGCGSVSLMQPMPLQPRNMGRSFSNLVRKGVFSMLWICRSKPFSRS